MNRKLGFSSIILLGINTIIGAGIFLFPHLSMKIMGPGSILAVMITGTMVLALASCFAEAANLFSKNGGPYVYVKEAFGSFAGFQVGFVKWIIQVVTWSSSACAFTIALGKIWTPANQSIVQNTIIVCFIVGLAVVNYLGVNCSKVLNNIITVSKLIPILLFLIVAFFAFKVENFTPFFINGKLDSAALGETCLLWFYAFSGFESIAVASEDMDNPKRNLPRAILIVMVCVLLFYLLIHALSIGVLGHELYTESAAIQVALSRIIGPIGFVIGLGGMLISITGINIANAFIAPRCAVALAEDKMLPPCFLKKSRFGSPSIAILVSTCIALVVAFSGSYVTLVKVSVVAGFLQYIPTCLAILKFRKSKKHFKRSFTIPGGPIIPIGAVVGCVFMLFQANPFELVLGLSSLCISIPFYFIMTRKYKKDVSV